ncbi:hypothetical protein WISP_22642 [Willisornis vidua]|uniref:Reverse transcriptase domain-containing protein n=1 Tax=Willisornis vidua TaxID=1566151 RepID=A0ABQ9DMR6_9PASS|nr:hypothetical protein WISP_22642 [Willisornis vidua]
MMCRKVEGVKFSLMKQNFFQGTTHQTLALELELYERTLREEWQILFDINFCGDRSHPDSASLVHNPFGRKATGQNNNSSRLGFGQFSSPLIFTLLVKISVETSAENTDFLHFNSNETPPISQMFKLEQNKGMKQSTPPPVVSGTWRADCKLANVVPVFKSKKENSRNHRPASPTSTPGKVMEKIILQSIEKHLKGNRVIVHSQHSFMQAKSCLSNLNSFYGKLTHGSSTQCNNVTSGVLQSLILGSELFSIFINDLDSGLEGILSKFTDDTKLGAAVESLEGTETLQRDLDKLEDYVITNHTKFSKSKCEMLHLGWGNPGCTYRLGSERLEISAMGDLGVLLDGKLNLSQQCPGSQEDQRGLGGHQAKHHQPLKEEDVLLFSALGQSHPEYFVQFWAQQYGKKTVRKCLKESNKDGEGP